MARRDLRKELKHLYQASAKAVAEVDVPALRFLMIDGEGDPNTSPQYAEAVEALFTVSYAAKFALKKAGGEDLAVMPLEGLWWSDDLTAFARGERARWRWTMMIMQPDSLTPSGLQQAIAASARSKTLPALQRLRIETFTEGRCAQVLHVGPFSTEPATIARLHAHIAARGRLRGRHHEIYLSDIRRADPSRWKTVIRQPME